MTPPTKKRPWTLDEVVARLTPAIGREKSHEAVSAAVQDLGTFDAEAVLSSLAADTGVIGMAARLLRSGKPTVAESTKHEGPEHPRAPRLGTNGAQSDSGLGSKNTIQQRAVKDLLASSLGEEAASEAVSTTLRQLGIEREELSMPEAHRLLEALAAMPGLVGITARFAKARLILLFRGSTPG